MARTHKTRRRLAGVSGALAVATLLGCSNAPPALLPIPETTVNANSMLQFEVAATDPDSDNLTLTMRGTPQGAALSQVGGKLAMFAWSPTVAQVGLHTVTFVADDGDSTDTESVNIVVVGGGAPELVSPSRHVVDLASGQVKFVLEVRDEDSLEVNFEFDPDPRDWGAEIEIGAKRLLFAWTPDVEQAKVAQHSFRLRATDPEGNTMESVIVIVLKGVHNDTCPSGHTPPQVSAEAIANQVGGDDYPVRATIMDSDSEISQAVVFYSTAAEPGDSDWDRANLEKAAGSIWQGAIPNLQLPPGESATVTWMVCASDNDDAESQRCDNSACTEKRTFTATTGLDACEPCQPGECRSGACVANGREAFCAGTCDATLSCPAGFSCEWLPGAGTSPVRGCVPSGCRASLTDVTCTCASSSPVAPDVGDLSINEVLYAPPMVCPAATPNCTSTERIVVDVNGDGRRIRDDVEEEFVEIVNRSDKFIQLQGLTLSDSVQVRFTFPAAVLAPRRAVLVFGGGDVSKFAALGGALKFAVQGGGNLSLTNPRGGGDSLSLKNGATVLSTLFWSAQATIEQSLTRQADGEWNAANTGDAAFRAHSLVSGSSGAKWSPGTHVCGTPFPLDAQACGVLACSIQDHDAEPQSDQRATAPCLLRMPAGLASTLSVNQADSTRDDTRDLFAIEGKADQWLHAFTAAGAAPAIEDTVLKLLARNGTLVDANDDDPWDPTNTYSRLIVSFPADGWYFLEVSPFAGTSSPLTGSYKLRVETTAAPPVKP